MVARSTVFRARYVVSTCQSDRRFGIRGCRFCGAAIESELTEYPLEISVHPRCKTSKLMPRVAEQHTNAYSNLVLCT